jgi:hypothetical protein
LCWRPDLFRECGAGYGGSGKFGIRSDNGFNLTFHFGDLLIQQALWVTIHDHKRFGRSQVPVCLDQRY